MAQIALDQDRPGPSVSSGVAGQGRNDLWVGRAVNPRSVTTSGTYQWTLLDKPVGSSTSLTSATAQVCHYTPDLPGSYRLRLDLGASGAEGSQIVIAACRYDSSGVLVNRGWRLPAVGETTPENNFGGQTRGYDEAFETIVGDLLKRFLPVTEYIIFRPGVTSGGNHVATWAEVDAFIAAYSGEVVVYIDDRTAACVIPGTADTQCFGKTIFRSWQATFYPGNFFPISIMSITDGGRLRNPHTFDGVVINAAPTSVNPIRMDASSDLVLLNLSIFQFLGGATVPFVQIDTNCGICCFQYSALSNAAAPTVAVIHLAAGITFDLLVENSNQSFGGTTFSGDNTTHIDVTHDASLVMLPQTLMLGALSFSRQDHANATDPSRGTTGQRPVTPVTGESYYDTTLNAPVWWNGTSWIAAANPPASLTTTNATPTRIGRYPIADGAVLSLRFILTVRKSDNSGAVLGEWEIKGAYKRVGGTLSQAYAPSIVNTFLVGSPGAPTLTLNGNTDVDLNVTGIAATSLVWTASEFTL